jgi:hypothetical protein
MGEVAGILPEQELQDAIITMRKTQPGNATAATEQQTGSIKCCP